MVIEILSFSCSVRFLVTTNGGHLGMPNCKKLKRLHTRNILAQSWINFNQWFLRYCHFFVYAIFSNGPWRPSWIVNLHKFEIVPLKKSKRLHTRNIPAQSWINFIQWCWEIVIFMFVLFLVMAPGGHLGLSVCKKNEFRNHCDLSLTKIHSYFH